MLLFIISFSIISKFILLFKLAKLFFNNGTLLQKLKNLLKIKEKMSKVNNTKMSIKPFLETFYPFHISSDILKVSGKALWQGSNVFQK